METELMETVNSPYSIAFEVPSAWEALPNAIPFPSELRMRIHLRSSGIGGVPSMTVVFVMIAGFSGVILGPLLLKWIRIRSSLGKGIAFGSASHALGTSKAMELHCF